MTVWCSCILTFQGFIFSKLLKLSRRKGFVDRESYVAQYLAFAIFITGLISTIGSDDLLAAFAAGMSQSGNITYISVHPPNLQVPRYHGMETSIFRSKAKLSPLSSISFSTVVASCISVLGYLSICLLSQSLEYLLPVWWSCLLESCCSAAFQQSLHSTNGYLK